MKKKVTRIILNGVPHRMVVMEDSLYEHISDVCDYCSLSKICSREDEDEEEPRLLCCMNGNTHNERIYFVDDSDSLDKTIRELLDESIEA